MGSRYNQQIIDDTRKGLYKVSIAMRKSHRRGFLLFILLLIAGLLAGCAAVGRISANPASIVYRNTEYGFSFILPASWKGYAILSNQWECYTVGSQGDVPA
jgi:hypothetical protein